MMGEDVACVLWFDNPPPLSFGTLFHCSLVSIGKGGLEFLCISY